MKSTKRFYHACCSPIANSLAGCFSKLKPRYKTIKVTTRIDRDLDDPVSLYAREMIPQSPHLTDDLDSQVALDEFYPLLGRAWAFQERIFSPRVLSFFPNEMLWECKEIGVCECQSIYTTVTDMPEVQPGPLSKLGWSYPPRDTSMMTCEGCVFFEEWRNLLALYCGLSLTRESDRLPALSSLARNFNVASGNNHTYLAGLWQHHHPNALLWHVSASPEQLGLRDRNHT